MYFVFSVVFTLPSPATSYLSTLTNTVSRVRACLSIWFERFRGNHKDERGSSSINSFPSLREWRGLKYFKREFVPKCFEMCYSIWSIVIFFLQEKQRMSGTAGITDILRPSTIRIRNIFRIRQDLIWIPATGWLIKATEWREFLLWVFFMNHVLPGPW